MSANSDLVLASSSTLRVLLLREIGIEPIVLPANIDEAPRRGESAVRLVRRLAEQKALVVLSQRDKDGAFVLGVDTLVAVGQRPLGRAETEGEARTYLRMLSGREHQVHSGIALFRDDHRLSLKVVTTRLRFRHLTADDIEEYVSSGEWKGRAGGYAILGRADGFVRSLKGSYTSVIGLPLHEIANILAAATAWPSPQTKLSLSLRLRGLSGHLTDMVNGPQECVAESRRRIYVRRVIPPSSI
ncbi:MAG: Maf family protein [Alphaproteobacteria bacterium]